MSIMRESGTDDGTHTCKRMDILKWNQVYAASAAQRPQD